MLPEESSAVSGSEPTPASTASLTEAERAVLDAATAYARRHDLAEPAEAGYLEQLPGARRSILHRLVSGLLRGTPEALAPAVTLSRTAPELPADAPPPLSETSADRLLVDLPIEIEGDRAEVVLLPFPASGSALVIGVADRHGYGRVRLCGDVHRWTPRGTNRVARPTDLVDPLHREGAFLDDEQTRRIGAELDESVANLAFARLAYRRFSARTGGGSVLPAPTETAPAADDASSLERLVVEGHPFHPAAKIRCGMAPAGALAYAPEFVDRIDLRFVAVRADHAMRTTARGEESLTKRLHDAFEGLAGAVERALPAGDLEEYAVVPVHPWQYHHVIPERYGDRIADGRVVPIPGYSRRATPLLNLRTVVPHATERTTDPPPHLKLAIGVRTTNVVRTLSPQAAANGPRVTELLRSIGDRESFDSLGFLEESAAACYHAPGGPHPGGEGFDNARHLSGLLRENPYAHPLVPGGTIPVAASSLLARSPASGRPLACEFVDRYARMTGAGVESFLADYLERVVPEQLLLLSKYGVALESHAQNSYVVFEDGRPLATLIRDFGGIRALDERLADHGLSIETYPDSDVAADGRRDLHRKLYYALFQNHLAELIATLSRHAPIEESTCWGLVRAECERAFDDLRADPEVPDRRVARDERVLFADPIEHKALTAMRLRGKRHEYVTSRVPNPLARSEPERP